MASRGGQSGSGAPSRRSERPDSRVSSNLKYEFGPGISSEQASEKIYGRVGDVEKEGDRGQTRERRERRQPGERREYRGNIEDREPGEDEELREYRKYKEFKESRGDREDRKDKEYRKYKESKESREDREHRKDKEYRKYKESKESRGDREHRKHRGDGHGRKDRDRSHGRSSITKTSTRSSASSKNNSAYPQVPPPGVEPDIPSTQDPIGSNMSTVSDDPTIRVSLRHGGRRMEVNVRSEHSSRKPRSGQSEAPPSRTEYSDSDETVTPRKYDYQKSTTHKSDSGKGNKHKVGSKHGARSRDSEDDEVEPSDSITSVGDSAQPDVTATSTRTPLPPRSEASTASRSVKPKSGNGKEEEHKVKSNHGARSRASEDPVAPFHSGNKNSYAPPPRSAMSGSTPTPTKIHTRTSTVSGRSKAPSQISSTSSSESDTSIYPASTILPPPPSSIGSIGSGTSVYPNSDNTSLPPHSIVSTGSRPAKHSNNNGKERKHEIRSDHSAGSKVSRSVGAPSTVSRTSTQASSSRESGVPEVAEKKPYLVPAYGCVGGKTPSMVPVKLLPKDSSEDSSGKWTADKVIYSPQLTAKPNAYFTHNQSK
ncbi:uncharacterized protein EAE97_004856 [Botrytis byssoidea]|uniref:Uncharacterized protein n=1 Tax=Botrytis byssoidea TaxID=139641 RepID=A0A9P5M645_9HELO|nr:uncharacterized protein EAE97_004856 [Botrytis byssoidea]KAF7945818.1 hypothetical protein EAE97_004856 [Botrytis byssoidea]